MAESGRSLWAALHLLDRQVVDRDGQLCAKVDDLEFAEASEPGGLPILTHLLCGSAALGRRFNPRLAAELEHLRRVVEPTESPGPARVSAGIVSDIGPAIKVGAARDELPVTFIDHWLARNVLAHIPGSGVTRKAQPDANH